MKRCVIWALMIAFFLCICATLSIAQEPPLKDAPSVSVKGKLPVGWSTSLKLSANQKDAIYAISSKYKAKIEALKTEEYRAAYGVLDNFQKAILRERAKAIIPE